MPKWTRLLILLSIISSGCGVKRPNIEACIVNSELAQRKCYNIHDDYDDDGNLLATAKPKFHPNVTVADLNKAFVIDSPYDADNPNEHHFEDGLAQLKAWIRELKDECASNRRPAPQAGPAPRTQVAGSLK